MADWIWIGYRYFIINRINWVLSCIKVFDWVLVGSGISFGEKLIWSMWLYVCVWILGSRAYLSSFSCFTCVGGLGTMAVAAMCTGLGAPAEKKCYGFAYLQTLSIEPPFQIFRWCQKPKVAGNQISFHLKYSFIYFHPFSSILSFSSISITHQVSLITGWWSPIIQHHKLSQTIIYWHPLSSTFFHFHPLSSILAFSSISSSIL